MTHLLIAFDGSSPAVSAIERAAALLPGADATVVAVAEGIGALHDAASLGRAGMSADAARTAVGRLSEAAHQEADQLAARGADTANAAGLRAKPLAVEAQSSVRNALLDACRDLGADLFVCGTRGHGRAARAILGSVSSGLAQHAEVPVLVVPAHAAAVDGPLLVGFDDSDEARAAITAAGALMTGHDALVVHVWRSQVRHTLTGDALRLAPLAEIREITGELDELLEGIATEVADRGAEAARAAGLDAQPIAIETDAPASEALLEAADAHDAPAIVIGRRGRGALAAAVLGSVSSSLLHAADRPVLIA